MGKKFIHLGKTLVGSVGMINQLTNIYEDISESSSLSQEVDPKPPCEGHLRRETDFQRCQKN